MTTTHLIGLRAVEELISVALDGQLNAAEEYQLGAHLASCEACASRSRAWRRVQERLPQPPSDRVALAMNDVRARLAREAAGRQVPLRHVARLGLVAAVATVLLAGALLIGPGRASDVAEPTPAPPAAVVRVALSRETQRGASTVGELLVGARIPPDHAAGTASLMTRGPTGEDIELAAVTVAADSRELLFKVGLGPDTLTRVTEFGVWVHLSIGNALYDTPVERVH